MKKSMLLIACAIITNFIWAQPTTYGVGAGVGGNLTNSYFGASAGTSNTTVQNTFIGASSGFSNTLGGNNTFLGAFSGTANTTGPSNTFIGYSSGYSNTTGGTNTFLGSQSGASNSTGSGNTFLGASTGSSNTTGGLNTFIGINSGLSNVVGQYNTFLGANSGQNNSSGTHNTFIGRSSGAQTTSGASNTYLGYGSGSNNQTGFGNVFIGYASGGQELGSDRLYIDNTDTTLPLIWGDFSTNVLKANGTLGVGLALGDNPTESVDVIGTARLRGVTQDDTQTRVLVTDVNGRVRWRDVNSLVSLGDDLGNHIATQSITANADAAYDIGSLVSAFDNLYFDGSLYIDNGRFLHNTSSSVALGVNALPAVTTGLNNVAIGTIALPVTTTGSSNTAIGYNAGPFQVSQGALSNTSAIGNQARTTGSNQVRIGNSNVSSIGGHAAWTNLSDGRFKYNIERDSDKVPGLDLLDRLEPVKYQVDRKKLGAFLNEEAAKNNEGAGKTTQQAGSEVGFIAQELMNILPADIASSIVDKPEDENTGPYGIRYSALIGITVNAVKQLHELVKNQQEEINELKVLLQSGAAETAISHSDTSDAKSSLAGVVLEQSYPNPSGGDIEISMTIPARVKTAFVIIHTLQGNMKVQSFEITGRGHTKLNINKGNLEPGMHSYRLVIDGVETESKRIGIK